MPIRGGEFRRAHPLSEAEYRPFGQALSCLGPRETFPRCFHCQEPFVAASLKSWVPDRDGGGTLTFVYACLKPACLGNGPLDHHLLGGQGEVNRLVWGLADRHPEAWVPEPGA